MIRYCKPVWATETKLAAKILIFNLYNQWHNASFPRLNVQVSSVADERARRDASRQTCCKQRWTLSVINIVGTEQSWQRLRHSTFSSYSELFLESRQFKPTQPAYEAFVGGDPVWVLPISLASWIYRVPAISCGFVCVMLRFAVSVERRLVTDRQSDTRLRHIPR